MKFMRKTKNFMRFIRKIKLCYISNFVNLKYFIHELILTFLIGLLPHFLLLIISGTQILVMNDFGVDVDKS